MIAALDVGGTTIKSGVVRGTAVELLPSVPSLSGGDRDTVLGQLVGACANVVAAAGPTLSGMAIAVPRPFDLDAGIPRITGLHKFESIRGMELRPLLRAGTGVGDHPIRFVGDAEAAGVGEARFGAGAGHRRVLTITLGTGMGACLTDGGVVVTAVAGVVVEDLHDRPVGSARADDLFSVRGLATLLGVDAADLRSSVGEPGHASGCRHFGALLGDFLGPILEEFAADVVVVAGGLSSAFDRFGPSMGIPAVPAAAGARGPLLGAAALAGF